ncbi:MAG: glucosylceramidase, partial [Treponema sp.]|nr:glucosylceramidase [Treponema sp.]
GYVLSLMPEAKRREAIDAYFSPETGNGYTLARTHMNSCDFSLENWACVDHADETLESFSMERPDKYITPLLQAARDASKGSLNLLISPWSPPAWMKDNNEMNHGGKLFKKYYPLWAAYFVRFITELKKRGIDTWAVTVQNEPAAVQTWDSCVWTGAEEGEFAALHLGPALEKYTGNSHKKIKLFVWDHNRDILWDRFSESMAFPNAARYIDGAAFHWYSGDQYENIAKIAKNFPDKDLLFSEGCVEGKPQIGAWFTGERYAHNIINDLNSGCMGWIDWNIVLDMDGGPNHVGNFCDAPIIADPHTGELHYQSSYYYMGHFSRFIKPGAKRIDFTYTDYQYSTPAALDGRMGNMAECCTFRNSDGSVILVLMNRTEGEMFYELKAGGINAKLRCPPRGIQTLILGE